MACATRQIRIHDNNEMDVAAQIAYWRDSALEDWVVAKELVANKHVRHGLFFLHLTLEKAVKAHVAKVTLDAPPKIHNLLRLAELASLHITAEQRDLLAEANRFSLVGRYPESVMPRLPDESELQGLLKHSDEVLTWLIQPL